MKKRETRIMEILSEKGRIEVTALASMLNVSQVTMRKDLDALGRIGIVRREHGYAVFGGSDDINNRLALHYEEKKRIARAAVKFVSPGETVMIENGSGCALLAEELAKNRSGVTIITNSAFIASYIRTYEGVNIILLGGDFQKDAQVSVGPILRACLQDFYVDKMFIGVDGYSKELGFSGSNHLRAHAVRDMAEHANRIYVLTESSKFSRNGIVPYQLGSKLAGVVTDAGISPECITQLESENVRVFVTETNY